MTESPWLAAGIALFAWWFATGAILWRVRVADNAGPDAHALSVFLTAPIFAAGVALAHASLPDASSNGAYLGFAATLCLWGWIELAFLSGIITGPNRDACPPFAPQSERFRRAVGTIAWHELALIATLLALAYASQGAENQTALYTFTLLFAARISSKFNLFLGVPRINTQFLPRPLRHLPSHFRFARMNPLFPLSVSGLTAATALLLDRTINATTPGDTTAFALLTTLCALALLEHWFMVLPLPDEKLWRWMLPAAKTHSPASLHEDANGL
ncbi:MAG: putative photosynthetic complex assembly protein PuhE [Paracoccaceae bacterium]